MFTSDQFKEICIDNKYKLTLAVPKHLEMN